MESNNGRKNDFQESISCLLGRFTREAGPWQPPELLAQAASQTGLPDRALRSAMWELLGEGVVFFDADHNLVTSL
jgi:hypothetical protein